MKSYGLGVWNNVCMYARTSVCQPGGPGGWGAQVIQISVRYP